MHIGHMLWEKGKELWDDLTEDEDDKRR